MLSRARLALRSPTRSIPRIRISRSYATTKNSTIVKSPKSKIGRNLTILAALAGSAYLIDEYRYSSLLQRSARAVYVLLWIAYQYGANTGSYKNMDDLHEIAAEKLFAMLEANKGLYIKQGQAIANQGSVFPVAYQKRFITLYDGAPEDSWKEVDKVLLFHLGQDYEAEVFEYIDHKPVASALIAQVHKARLKREQKDVAVKVQHPYIARQINVDLAVYRGMTWLYSQVFDLPLSIFTQYVSDQLLREADFRLESANAAELARLLAGDSAMKNANVYVPRNFDEYTSRQVLVTEWIEGIPLTDKQRLLDANFNLTTTMSQYTSVFGRQIFHYGFVHSDPHPGNLLARFHDGKQQLVILDHGLYITLPQKFREEYCRIWKCMFDFDQKQIEEIAESWGVGSTGLLTAMVLLSPPKDGVDDSKSSKELIKSFLGDGTKFPLQMLFLLRTMRMMQNLNQSMGSPVNRMNILTKSAVLLLTQEQSWTNLGELVVLARIRVVLFFSDVVFLFFRMRQILSGDRYNRGEGIEDYIEKHIRNTAKSMGIEIVEGM